jgi:hypothetical protein
MASHQLPHVVEAAGGKRGQRSLAQVAKMPPDDQRTRRLCVTKNRDGVAIGRMASGQLKTWADDLKRLYSLPSDGSFDDLVHRLDRSTGQPQFSGKRRG